MEKIVIPVVSCIGKLFPNLTVQGYGDASYAHSLLKRFKGEWVYNTDWKMMNGHPKKAGWIKAIQEAQQTVKKWLSASKTGTYAWGKLTDGCKYCQDGCGDPGMSEK